MRLEAHEIAAIRDAARAIFGGTAAVRVFGSPIHDHVRGGDLDLFLEVEPGQATSANEAAFRDRIGGPLDELKVDVVFHERGQPPLADPRDRSARRSGPLSGAEPALLRQGLQAAERYAMRLERSVARLEGLFALDPVRLQSLAPQDQDDIDAFLKRFEQLVLSLEDQVFAGVAILEGENLHELSRRDVTELMERLGAISSAKEFRNLATIRNRLAHLYPEDPARQAGNLNEAFQASPTLLAAARHIASFATRRTAGEH